MTATVECPNGKSFQLDDNTYLNSQVAGFEILNKKDRLSLITTSVMGLPEGYELAYYAGNQEVTATVTKEDIITIPMGKYDQFPMLRGHVYVLGGGTKIVPNE
jgi:hypothetical protein